MNAISDIIKLLIPFIKEYGISRVDILESIRKNKFAWGICFCTLIMFSCVLYAVDQANTRMAIQLTQQDQIEDLKDKIAILENNNKYSEAFSNKFQEKDFLSNEETLDAIISSMGNKETGEQ